MSATMKIRDDSRESAIDRQMFGHAEIAVLKLELAGVRRTEESDSGMSRRSGRRRVGGGVLRVAES